MKLKASLKRKNNLKTPIVINYDSGDEIVAETSINDFKSVQSKLTQNTSNDMRPRKKKMLVIDDSSSDEEDLNDMPSTPPSSDDEMEVENFSENEVHYIIVTSLVFL